MTVVPPVTDATIVARRGMRFEGRVLGAGGAPDPQARVWAIGRSAPGFMSESPSIGFQVDALGTFSLRGLEQDTDLVVAWAPGHSLLIHDFADGAPPEADLRLPVADGVLRGCVVDDSGAPLPEASVTVVSIWRTAGSRTLKIDFGESPDGAREMGRAFGVNGTIPVAAPPSAMSGPDGTFELKGVSLGPDRGVSITVSKPGYRAWPILDVSESFVELKLSAHGSRR